MSNPQQKTQAMHRWEVLKGNKIYPIATDDLLARLWQENRLSSSTKVRRAGEVEWRDHDSINWSTFVAMVTDTIAPSTSEDTEVEAAETAEVSITEESLRAEAELEKGSSFVAPAAPQNEVPSWWHDESATSSPQSRKTMVGLTIVAAVAITACLLTLAILSSRLLLPRSPASVDVPRQGPLRTDVSPSMDQPSPAMDASSDASQTPAAVAEIEKQTPAASDVSPLPSAEQQSETIKSKMDESQPLTIKDAASPSQPSLPPAAAPAATTQPVDGLVQDLLEKLKASLMVYRETRQDLLKCREEIRKSEVELKPFLELKPQLEVQAQAAQERIKQALREMFASQEFIRTNGGFQGQNNPVVQAEKIRLANAEKEGLEAEKAKALLETQHHNIRSREANHSNLIHNVGIKVLSITQREVASLDKFLELMDFFGEKPLEYHRQVFEITDRLLHEEPDVFYAQVLNSAAAIHLQRYEVPGKNLSQLNAHVQSIEPGEYKLRLESLRQFRALALALAGLADWRNGRRSNCIKQVDQSLELAPKLVELQLIRGMIGTDLKGINDGNSHFSRAARTNPNDPRVYRIGLDSLLASRSPPAQMFPKLLERLLKTIRDDDESSWLTAAATCIALNKPDEAQQHLKKVHSPMFQERKQKLLEKLQ